MVCLLRLLKTHLKKIPEYFIRRQTMVNVERFVTEDLKELDDKLISAKEQAVLRESKIYQELLQSIGKSHLQLKQLGDSLALFDMVSSLAHLAIHFSYVKPKINQHNEINLKQARHPVVESFVGEDDFISNDIYFSKDVQANAYNRSEYGRKIYCYAQTALCALLSQVGSYVPASEAFCLFLIISLQELGLLMISL